MSTSSTPLEAFTASFEAGPTQEEWSHLKKALDRGGRLKLSRLWLWHGRSCRLQSQLQRLMAGGLQERPIEAWLAVRAGMASAGYLSDAVGTFCQAVGDETDVLICSQAAPWWHCLFSRIEIILVFRPAGPG